MTGNAIVTIDRIERRVASRIVIEIAAGLSRRGCSAKGAMGSRTTPQDTWDEPEERGWARSDLASGLLRSPTTENGPSTNSLMCPTLGGELTLKKWML